MKLCRYYSTLSLSSRHIIWFKLELLCRHPKSTRLICVWQLKPFISFWGSLADGFAKCMERSPYSIWSYLSSSTIREGTGLDFSRLLNFLEVKKFTAALTFVGNDGNSFVLEISGPKLTKRVAFIVSISSTLLAHDNSKHDIKLS